MLRQNHEDLALRSSFFVVNPPLRSAKDCDRISFVGTHLSFWEKQHAEDNKMAERDSAYYVVRKKAIPEVLLKVVEAKRLVEAEKVASIQEAVEAVGISRSSFYKYKDDIFEFHENAKGTTVTLMFQMDDQPGILSDVLKCVAQSRANILTIHQSIPIGGMASLTLSIQILENTEDIAGMLEQMERQEGVHHVNILARE